VIFPRTIILSIAQVRLTSNLPVAFGGLDVVTLAKTTHGTRRQGISGAMASVTWDLVLRPLGKLDQQ